MAKARLRDQKTEATAAAEPAVVAGESDFETIDPENFESTDSEFQGFESTEDEGSDAEQPTPAKQDAETAKIAKVAEQSGASKVNTSVAGQRGVLYIGRIPHGLYEDQLRSYFSQFGTITRLRVSRNKRTGASKHYGFIEFASRDVAQIVCEAMDNYLLFGHILKVKMMDPAQVHADLWLGANSKFHAIPWGLVNKQRLERKHPREYWEQKQEEAVAEREAKARKLKELGIKY